ncbi:MAG: M23 family metallopeptidase [Firmicutes bacterium]|nr:M23 family metallopeptidase [Bacillota bacterium]
MKRRQRLSSTRDSSYTEVRPAYTVYPDDDMYGSPRSWSGAILSPSEKDASSFESRPAAAPDSPLGTGTYPSRNGGRRPSRPPFPDSGRHERTSPFVTQLIGSIFLLGACFLFFHSDKPVAVMAQKDITSAYEQDFTYVALPPAVARSFGTLPSSGIATPAVALPPLDVVAPLKGKVVQAYTKFSPDVIIDGRPGSPVVAATDGLVDSAGESQANGFYVSIDHGTFGQTVYAHLGQLRVHAHEYVTAGQIIGYLPSSSGKLTFGYIRGGSYQNPGLLLHSARP